jgi:hypothetical protein
MPRYASLVATGCYLPEREISNDLLRARFPEPPDFVDKMEAATGIRRRWWAPDDWAASDLAVRAARQALQAAGSRPEDIDLIVLGTDSPDCITPATSVVLQDKLGAKNAGTFDVGLRLRLVPHRLCRRLRPDRGQSRLADRARGGLPHAQARRRRRSDGVLLRRWRRRGGARGLGRTRLPQLRLPGGRLLRGLLGSLLRRHGRAGERGVLTRRPHARQDAPALSDLRSP